MQSTSQPSLLRTLGFWLALLIVLAQLINATRGFSNAGNFAGYFGAPLNSDGQTAWVHIYAWRALFMALLAGVLLATKQIRALSLMALIAVLMPIGDLWVVVQAGASTATIARHAVIGVVLLITWFSLSRWSQANTAHTA